MRAANAPRSVLTAVPGGSSATTRAFGAYAAAWASRFDEERERTVCSPDGFGAAVCDVIEARRNGQPRSARVLFEDPRRAVLRTIAPGLTGNTAYDEFMQRMTAFARGLVTLNGQSQAAFEQTFFGPPAMRAWRDLCLTADRVLFRSHYELERAVDALGYRPTRSMCLPVLDARVPPPAGTRDPGGSMVFWADGLDDNLLRVALRLASDIPCPRVVIRDEPFADCPTVRVDECTAFLAGARLIVSLSDDPGTAIALAAFGRPLCAATHGSAEYMDNVQTFDIWDPGSTIDALLRGLAAPAPAVRGMTPASMSARSDASHATGCGLPLVSIVVTVYDRLDRLRLTLSDLQRQTYPNIEIIVVSNNGPRADAVCGEFANVRYVHRAQNSGRAGEPRNDGIAVARGDFITALDDDDVFFVDHIASMVAACGTGTDLVYSNFLIQIVAPQPDGSEVLLGYDVEEGVGITAFELLVTNRVGYMTVFARRELYERYGAYDQVGIASNSETELWLRLCSASAMAHVDRPTTMYTIRHKGTGSLTAVQQPLFADGYETMYAMYPADGLRLVQAARLQHLAALRSTNGAPPREPRYRAASRPV